MKPLLNIFADARPEELDGLWAILKYREIGILRKIRSMSALMGLEEKEEELVISEAPKDGQGRILDHETRHLIHSELIKYSQKLQK